MKKCDTHHKNIIHHPTLCCERRNTYADTERQYTDSDRNYITVHPESGLEMKRLFKLHSHFHDAAKAISNARKYCASDAEYHHFLNDYINV